MTIEQQALALVNEVRAEVGGGPVVPRNINPSALMALCRALERHEAFRQEVHNSVVSYFGPAIKSDEVVRDYFSRFIIAPPVDPLVEAIKDAGYATLDAIKAEFAHDLRAALAKHGLQITGVET